MPVLSLFRRRGARWPAGHKPSTWARTGRREAARARRLSCKTGAARPERAPAPSPKCRATGKRSADCPEVVFRKNRRIHPCGRRPQVDDERDSSARKRRPVAPKDLADAPAQAVSGHGVADPSRNGDPQPRRRSHLPRKEKNLKMAPGNPDPGGVALFEFPSFSKAVVTGEGLPNGRSRVHTESLFRPFRRRAESTARPERVRIRTKKPCVRLRRRLLG